MFWIGIGIGFLDRGWEKGNENMYTIYEDGNDVERLRFMGWGIMNACLTTSLIG